MKGVLMMHRHRLLMAVMCATLLGTPVFADDLKVGDKAPDFTLPGSDGRTYSLSDLKGKTVVLAWFPKAFTGG
jgi:peroxiredoxin Q/BCP